MIYSENCSHAQVMAKAFFSTRAACVPVSDMALDAYVTGSNLISFWYCNSTANNISYDD